MPSSDNEVLVWVVRSPKFNTRLGLSLKKERKKEKRQKDKDFEQVLYFKKEKGKIFNSNRIIIQKRKYLKFSEISEHEIEAEKYFFS